MTTRRILAAAVAIAIWTCGVARAGVWFEEQTLVHDDIERYYRYYLPDIVPPAGHPLVLVLHGGGGSMRNVTTNTTQAEWPEIADTTGVLVVVPNGVNRTTGDPSGDDQAWNDCRGDLTIPDTTADDVGFLTSLVDHLATQVPVDPARVYVTGASNGGMMSYRMAFERGDRIAAIAAYIANLPAVSECVGPDRAIPVFIANGDAEDDYMPWDGGCVKATNSDCGRGTVLSAEATREFWIRHNGIDPTPSESFPFPDIDPLDGSTTTRDLHVGGFEGAEVEFLRMFDAGHNTPTIDHPRSALVRTLLGLGNQCRDLEGSREAWAFFERHTLNGTGAGTSPGRAGLLRVERAPDGLTLRWSGDCGSATSYGVYRGDLGAGYGSLAPEPGACAVAATSVTVPLGTGAADFFLVVPNDGATEGGYGADGDGAARPPAASTCRPAGPVDACAAHP